MTTKEAQIALANLKRYISGGGAVDRNTNKAIDMAIEALGGSEPHWIPVTQALPEDDTVVLVCGKNGGIYTAIHNNSKTWIRGWWKMNSKNHYCNPVAWMPLPHPVRLEKNNG